MVAINNLSVHIKDKPILKDVSIHFKKGEFTTIVGPNGCGKSTLIKSITGLIKSEGLIVIDDKKRESYNRKAFARKVATLMQDQTTPYGMTVEQLISNGRHPHRKIFESLNHKDTEIIRKAMLQTRTYELKDRFIHSLSGGERQRVWLAMTLCQEPDVLILDEPTNHLDIKYQYELMKIVSRLNKDQGITIICVLHDIPLAAKFSDTVIVLKNGELIKKGTPKECFTKEIMHSVYEVKANVNFCPRNNFTMSID